jgi:hypothetical protein
MYICRLCHNLTVGNINEISIYLSNNIDYAQYIGILEGNLQTTHITIQILQGLIINALTLHAIKLPYPPEYSRDRKELPNFILKVSLRLVGENSYFLDN